LTVIEPTSVDDVAAALSAASRAGQRVSIRGGGTKCGLVEGAPAVDIVLSTARLNTIVAHRHGDLTATVQAGAKLADVNRALGRHRQWIPLDPPWRDSATIGGVVAANDSGPRRHRYGAPRDLIIGVEIVLADGTAAKAGGIVVKNVAGYDLSRLMTGSFGSLAAIVSATFKLYPVPSASCTAVVDATDRGALGAVASSLNAGQLTPTAVELQVPPGRLLVRFETTATAARQQAEGVLAIAAGAGCDGAIVSDDEEARMWSEHEKRPWQDDGAVIKVSFLPTELTAVLSRLDEAADAAGYDAIGRAGVGVLLVRIAGDAHHQASVVAVLRDGLPPGRGSAVVVRASRELTALLDPWGPVGDAAPLMRAVKQRFDPNATLSSGPTWVRG
jgi:glycolate dehydrogenase FAD-binding subunit